MNIIQRAVVTALAATAIGSVNLNAAHADVPPYGGCKEVTVDYPAFIATEGADWCRDHGWVIRPRVVITPNHTLRYLNLPACKTEDSMGCYWDADHRGNGRGQNFVAVASHRYPVVTFGTEVANA